MPESPTDSPAAEFDRRIDARVSHARRGIVRFAVWSLVGEFATWALIVAFGQNEDWGLTWVALVIWATAWTLNWIPVGAAAFMALRNVTRLPPAWVAAGLVPWVVHSGWVAFILLMYLA